MKTFEEFKKNFAKIRENTKMDLNDFDNVVKRKYEEYKNARFNEWLSQYSADEINKSGIDIYRKIFDAMDKNYFEPLTHQHENKGE